MKTVILGGGPSGLGVAWGLVEAGVRDIVIVEKNAKLGGLSGSFVEQGITLDFGPHRLSPEYPDLVEKIKKLLGTDLLEVENHHAVVFQNHVYRYPPVLADFLNLSTMLTSVKVLASFFAERFKSTFRPRRTDTFESVIISRFGRSFYDKVVRPMSTKVWGDPTTLDADFAKLRFSVPTMVQWFKKFIGHRDTFNDKVFYYPRQGFQQLWDVLGEHLKSRGVKIILGATPTSLRLEGDRAVAMTMDRAGSTEEIPVNWVISTIPTQHFTRLLVPNPLSASELLAHKFHNRGMILALFVVKKPKSLPARVIVFPEAKYVFNRLSEQNQFSRTTVPGERSAILADIITDVDSAHWKENDETLLKVVEEQIRGCGFFTAEEVESKRIFRVPIAYPLPSIDRESAQQRFNELVSRMENILCTGRFASSDYNNCHTALKKGIMAARTVVEQRALRDWYPMAESIRKTAIRD
jgi:protoporphyrinogen oxidase